MNVTNSATLWWVELGGRLARAASPVLNRIGGVVGAGVEAFDRWHRRRATILELSSLDDRVLKDIGIYRADIPEIARALRDSQDRGLSIHELVRENVVHRAKGSTEA